VVLNRLTHKNPKIWEQDIVTEPLVLDEKFDFIFSYSVWNHIARNTKNVKEILNDIAVKYLKDDGLMVISHCDPKRIASDKSDIVLVDDCKTESVLVKNNGTRWTTWCRKTSMRLGK
jgi:2-polyprenyl-3-methyl-5-hydroxy-6-metoxy-1,4-benzoquinol methylase